MLRAITRAVSPSINRCELSFHARQPIDVEIARAQHRAYEDTLRRIGVDVVELPEEPDLPDAVFVEDPAIVLDEVAVINRMGAESRRAEAASLGVALARYRPIEFLTEPATLDGGDVMRIGPTLFVGASHRTNPEGIRQLSAILRPHGYDVEPIAVNGCLHLKSACSYIGNDTVLINKFWIDASPFEGLQLIEVPVEEPGAANALLIERTVILPASFPLTREKLDQHGFRVQTVDVSELQKAESGVSCMSVIFRDLTAA